MFTDITIQKLVGYSKTNSTQVCRVVRHFCYYFAMDLLTVRAAAGKLQITVWRVHQLIKARRLPAQKLGSQYVIKKGDLKLVANRKPGRPAKVKPRLNGTVENGTVEVA